MLLHLLLGGVWDLNGVANRTDFLVADFLILGFLIEEFFFLAWSLLALAVRGVSSIMSCRRSDMRLLLSESDVGEVGCSGIVGVGMVSASLDESMSLTIRSAEG